MCQQYTTTNVKDAPRAILTFSLSMDKAEVILIALNALYESQKIKNSQSQKILVDGMRMFGIDTLPLNLDNRIGELCDEIFFPLDNCKNPVTAEQRLMQMDIDDLNDGEIQTIIEDIETQHGKISLEAL